MRHNKGSSGMSMANSWREDATGVACDAQNGEEGRPTGAVLYEAMCDACQELAGTASRTRDPNAVAGSPNTGGEVGHERCTVDSIISD